MASLELLADARGVIEDLISKMEPYWAQMHAHDEAQALHQRINDYVSANSSPPIITIELFVCDVCARPFSSSQACRQHRRDRHHSTRSSSHQRQTH